MEIHIKFSIKTIRAFTDVVLIIKAFADIVLIICELLRLF